MPFLQYRKFSIAILALAINTTMLAIGRIDQSAYSEVSIWVISLYMVGNAAEHLAKRSPVSATVQAATAVLLPPTEGEGK